MKKLLNHIVMTGCMVILVATAFTASAQDRVRIGVEGAYPPFSWVDADGELQGFDIDIAWALCEAMEAECVLVPQDWDGIIPALLARKYDAILASMSITEERRQRVDFTDKYYHTPARFVGANDLTIDLVDGPDDVTVTTLEGIRIHHDALSGMTVGVQRATIHDRFISDVFGDTVDVRRYGTQDEAYLDLVSGRLDLIMADSIAILDGFLNTDQGSDYQFIGPAFAIVEYHGEGAGIAVRKGDDALRERFNAAIEHIRADGTYQAIQDRYFDFDVYGG